MRRVITTLLAAATALTPLAAEAQRGRWGEDRPQRADRDAGPAQPRPDRAQPRADRPQRSFQPRADAQAQRSWQGRSDQGQRTYQPSADAQPQRTWQGRPDQGQRAYQPRGDRGTWQGRPDTRRDGNRDDRRRDWGRSYADRRDSWNATAGFYDRRDWNRGWRSDNRFDWLRGRAENRYAYRLPRYYAPGGWTSGYRRFGIGAALSPLLWAQDYWIDDPYEYRLPPAYGPYRWVRYYNDALLVDLEDGQVVDVVYDIFL
jgi:Ni/Co efflux regulator RcnB